MMGWTKLTLAAAGVAGVALTAQVSEINTPKPQNVVVQKSDKLDVGACANATWPQIPADCLSFVKDDASARHPVSYITVARKTGEAETTLIRVPRTDVASH